MVLEGLDSPPDSSSPAPDSPGNDAYSTNQHLLYHYDAESLPHPLRLPFLNMSDTAMRMRMQVMLRSQAKRMARPVTAEEAQAFAGHVYAMETNKSYIAAGAGLAGVYRWYATMQTNRYPFWATTNVDPNKFMFIKGAWAQPARHSWRLALYWIVATQLGDSIAHIIQQPITTKAIMEDPRLRQSISDTQAASKAHKGDGKLSIEDIVNIQKEVVADYSGASGSNQTPNVGGFDDDMSPTASADSPWNSSASSSYSSHDDSSYTPSAQSSSQPSQAWGRRPPPSQQQQQSPFADDASPTGGLFQAETQNSTDASGSTESSGSAWERLRRGGSLPPIQRPPPPGRPPRRPQREDSTIGDSFTFAGSEEERRRGQDQAQREFDERIERERQGKDFNDEERRW